MKLKRLCSIPFALVADVVTLGNMGDRSFTQQVFDAERRERELKEAIALAAAAAEIILAAAQLGKDKP